MCWIYDCDYSYLADPSITQLVFAGPRCRDHYLRALLAGVSADKMVITDDVAEGAKLVDIENHKDVLLLYELYRDKDAAAAKKCLMQRGQEGV